MSIIESINQRASEHYTNTGRALSEIALCDEEYHKLFDVYFQEYMDTVGIKKGRKLPQYGQNIYVYTITGSVTVQLETEQEMYYGP